MRRTARSPEAASALVARDDFVREVPEDHRAASPPDGSAAAPAAVFAAASGPFRRYRREVVVAADGSVVESIDYAVAIPWFGWLFAPGIKAALRRSPGAGPYRQPWWAPPDRLDARSAEVLGLLAGASVVVGFVNTLLTQTIAFAGDEFAAGDAAQGLSLAVVRAGVLLAFVVLALADRVGRRRTTIVAAVVGSAASILGAVAPNLPALTATQVVARPFAIALGLIVAIVAAEEVPAGSRAYATSVLAMATGLGAGVCVAVLPLADLGTRGWRLVYVAPALFVFIVISLTRHLPESRRFTRSHAESVPLRGHLRRFALLAASGLLINLLVAPASGFQNRFLKRERGFSASRISLFTLTTNTPGAIGLVVGGRLADVHSRRTVAAIGLLGGTLATVAMFFASGWPMWGSNLVGAVMGAATVPALGVYGAELFPTGLRGKANGAITVLSLAGSAIGLVVAGALADRSGHFGPSMALLGTGPLVVIFLVLAYYPETARAELEDLNPQDRQPPK